LPTSTGESVKKFPEEFDQEVQMWVFEEKVRFVFTPFD
jgi:hypothetical protein